MSIKPIINIKEGDRPKGAAIIEAAKAAHMNARGWTAVMRDDAMNEPTLKQMGIISETPRYAAALTALLQFEYDLQYTIELDAFNANLWTYKKAVARLERVQLSQGRSEIYEDQPTGEFDENGDPVLESVLAQPAIEPLPATVEQVVYDEAGTPTTTMVDNPVIVQDDLERSAAQAVVDSVDPAVAAYIGAT